MIESLMLALALQGATVNEPQTDYVWIASITLHAKQLKSAELPVAQHYASCISLPYFPMPSEFDTKRQKCRALPEIASSSRGLISVLDRLDSLVRNQPGSEASLKVTKP
jgi:hypothetical protein